MIQSSLPDLFTLKVFLHEDKGQIGQHETSRRGFHIPVLTELKYALHHLSRKVNQLMRRVWFWNVVEILCYAPDDLLAFCWSCILGFCKMDASMRKHTVFTMLAKKGDRSNVQNWRPVGSLKVIAVYCPNWCMDDCNTFWAHKKETTIS